MNSWKRKFMLLCLLVVVIGTFVWLRQGSDHSVRSPGAWEPSDPGTKQESTVADDATEDGSTDQPKVPPAGLEQSTANAGFRSALEIERMAERLSEAVPDLLYLARNGDTDALAALDRVATMCIPMLEVDARAGRPAGHVNEMGGQLAQQALDRLTRFCDFDRLNMSLQDLMDEFGEIRRARLESGDPIALMNHFSTPDYAGTDVGFSREEVVQLAGDLASNSDDPAVVAAALNLLLGAWDGPGAAVPAVGTALREFRTDPALATTGPERRRDVMRLASQWLACDAGVSCAAYGSMQEGRCILMGDCASHLPVQEYIRQRLLTPAEFEAMMRLVRSLRRNLWGDG